MNQQENHKDLKPDIYVEKLVTDPSTPPPDLKTLHGWLGKSNRAEYWRLYLTPELNEFIEVLEGNILHTQSLVTPDNPLGGVILWIRKNTMVQHTYTTLVEAQADFLQGDLQSLLSDVEESFNHDMVSLREVDERRRRTRRRSVCICDA